MTIRCLRSQQMEFLMVVRKVSVRLSKIGLAVIAFGVSQGALAQASEPVMGQPSSLGSDRPSDRIDTTYRFVCASHILSLNLTRNRDMVYALSSAFLDNFNVRETEAGRELAEVVNSYRNPQIIDCTCERTNELLVSIAGRPNATGERNRFSNFRRVIVRVQETLKH